MIKRKIKLNKKGFTLIETLVAITILLLSIVGPMSIAANGLFYAYYGRDQITAYYLAQEGIEYVRNVRDELYLIDYAPGNAENISLDPLAWLGWKGIISNSGDLYKCFPSSVFSVPLPLSTLPTTPPQGVGNGCYIDSIKSEIKSCSIETGCPALNYDTGIFIYSYDTGITSKFTRTVKITPSANQTGDINEATIESKVSWMNGSQQKSFVLTERIYNWQRQ